MKKLKILLCNAGGYGNLGDDMLRDIALEKLTKRFPLIEFYHDRPYPDEELINSCDLRIIGPGGLLYDDNETHTEYFLKYAKSPFILFGIGMQNIHKQKKNGLTAKLVRNADIIISRHAGDCEIIDSIRDKRMGGAYLYPDLGYFFKPKYKIKFPKRKPFTITLCPVNPTYVPEEAWKYISYVIGFSTLNEKVVNDMGRKINPYRTTCDYYYDSPDLAWNLIANSDLVITSRYHAGVLAINAGTPVVYTDTIWKLLEFKQRMEWADFLDHPKFFCENIKPITEVQGFKMEDIKAGLIDPLKPIEKYLKEKFNYGEAINYDGCNK